jgi:hypothetical protein
MTTDTTIRFRLLIFILVAAAVISGCSKDSDNNPVTPPDTPAGDYFPMKIGYVWSFTTNIFANRGFPEETLELRLDTLTTAAGKQWWMLARFPDLGTDWAPLTALLDSNNTVYSLGDQGNATPLPLFNHAYLPSEGSREQITVQGQPYQTIRIDYTDANSVTVSWWLADGIGLVKEHSSQGASLFLDDNWGSDIDMNTELLSLTK